MTTSMRLSDFVETHAHCFICQGAEKPVFASEQHLKSFVDALFEIIEPSLPLIAGNSCDRPLIPGYHYHLKAAEAQSIPGYLVLSVSDKSPENGDVAISPLSFLNAFADTAIVEDRGQNGVSSQCVNEHPIDAKNLIS